MHHMQKPFLSVLQPILEQKGANGGIGGVRR